MLLQRTMAHGEPLTAYERISEVHVRHDITRPMCDQPLPVERLMTIKHGPNHYAITMAPQEFGITDEQIAAAEATCDAQTADMCRRIRAEKMKRYE